MLASVNYNNNNKVYRCKKITAKPLANRADRKNFKVQLMDLRKQLISVFEVILTYLINNITIGIIA